ncbi:MAG: hypothetical protein AAF297_01655 [Planctomycetota bacterium]
MDKPQSNESVTDRAANTCTSMHEDVETWDDICVCEPEARWAAAAEELGIDT